MLHGNRHYVQITSNLTLTKMVNFHYVGCAEKKGESVSHYK